MKIALLILCLVSSQSFALVKGTRGSSPTVGMITREDGGICTATLIGNGYALTAAHCLRPRLKMAFQLGETEFLVSKQIAHPLYNTKARDAGKVTVDLALIKIGKTISKSELANSIPKAGESLTIYGFGTNGGSHALEFQQKLTLKVTGNPGRLQVRLSGHGGACRGDSGGPAFNENGGIAGVISWSTGKGKETCGALTGLTPIAPHVEWIIGESAK
jgi:hypothetical protein